MTKKFSLAELAGLTESLLVGNPDHLISNVDGLDSAGEEDASFLANSRYLETMKLSSAGVICIDRHTKLVEGKNYLISDDPSNVFQKISHFLLSTKRVSSAFSGVHERAVVHEGTLMESNVTIGPCSVVDQGVSIGKGSCIGPNCSIGPGVKIGEGCVIHAGVIIREGALIGNRVVLQPGCVIGSCGFGYLTDQNGHHQKLDQLGIVILEDDVEVGANTTIDRARFKATLIKRGTKIDNLVQLGHNVTLGEDNIIVAQTGIAGSSKTGRHVVVGGQCGITGHIELGDGVQLATRSGVSKSLKTPGPYRGSPAIPLAEYNKREVLLRNIKKFIDRIKKLEEKLM